MPTTLADADTDWRHAAACRTAPHLTQVRKARRGERLGVKWMTTAEVAELLGVTVHAIRGMAARGTFGETRRHGCQHRIDAHQVASYLREQAPDGFFPREHHRYEAAAAVAICQGCPVARACLSFAIEHDIDEGIWGGLNREQRELIARRQPQPSTRPTPEEPTPTTTVPQQRSKRLTPEDEKHVRRRYQRNLALTGRGYADALAIEYGVSRRTIQRVVTDLVPERLKRAA